MTHRAEFVFKVKEYESGQPWIMLEPLRAPDLPLPANCRQTPSSGLISVQGRPLPRHKSLPAR